MEMQSHKVSGGNAESPDASNTKPLMQSTPAQGNVIDPHEFPLDQGLRIAGGWTSDGDSDGWTSDGDSAGPKR